MSKQVKSKQRVSDYGEVFTAEREVKSMCDLVLQETERIDSRFLEPACGDGNFLAEVLDRKLAIVKNKYKKSPLDYEKNSLLAVSSLYGVDIMADNVEACRERLYKIWAKQYKSVCKALNRRNSPKSLSGKQSLNKLMKDSSSLQNIEITDKTGESATNNNNCSSHNSIRSEGRNDYHVCGDKTDKQHTEILLPDNAPKEYADRSTLWNAVEAVEKSKNAQLSREIEIALPNELSETECIELAREFAQRTFVDKGMCADVCIHNPNREQKNIHAHIMLTMRPFNEDGTWGDKQRREYILDSNGNKIYDKRKRTYKCRTVQTTDWNSREKAEEWRAEWENFINSALAEKGIIEKVDHRSFERQGKLEKPTVHMGVAATQMERKGIRTVKGDTNREIKSINAKISALLKRIEALDDTLSKMKGIPKEDSLIEMLMRFHDNGIKFSEVRGVSVSNLKKISKFKDLTHLIAFVQGHNIGTLSELSEKSSQTKEALKIHKRELIGKQSRIKELEELLNNYPRYKENKAVYLEWQSITNPKKKEKFYDKHYGEIALFKTAKTFYDNKLSDAKITPKAWQRELDELTKSAEVDRAKVEKLGDDVAVMETLIYNVQRLTNYEEKQNEIQRRRSAELE